MSPIKMQEDCGLCWTFCTCLYPSINALQAHILCVCIRMFVCMNMQMTHNIYIYIYIYIYMYVWVVYVRLCVRACVRAWACMRVDVLFFSLPC